jgi:cytochrome c551/c552
MNWLRQRRLIGVATLLLVLGSLLAACAPDPTTQIITPDLGPQMIAAAQSNQAEAAPVEEEVQLTLADLSEEEVYAGLDEASVAAIQAGDPANGETLALVNGCIGCHALDPDAQMTGPTWYNMGNTAVNRVPGESPAYYLHQSIVAPNEHIVSGYPQGIMPQTYVDTLSEQDLGDLTAYLLAQQQATE